MVRRAELEQTEHGLAATGDGWFVVNARETIWRERPGRGFFCELEGKQDFPQLGINIQVLGPGEPMSMYHYENDQEDFLVLSGDALLIVEGEERPLRAWDFVHTPAGAKHTIVAGGSGCVVLAVGARDRSTGPDWGGYPVDETALRHDAGVETETTKPPEAYARFPESTPVRYRDGLLPDLSSD
jgi:uncharacterized cupin superfamily protein